MTAQVLAAERVRPVVVGLAAVLVLAAAPARPAALALVAAKQALARMPSAALARAFVPRLRGLDVARLAGARWTMRPPRRR